MRFKALLQNIQNKYESLNFRLHVKQSFFQAERWISPKAKRYFP